MCRVAAKKLLNKALHIRREHAGSLLKAARLVQSMELTDKNDFGDGCHMASTEPFFYDSAYKLVKRECYLPIDTHGRCVIAKKVYASPMCIYLQGTISFDKLVCRIIKEWLSACHMATVTEIILISEFHAHRMKFLKNKLKSLP